MDILKRILFSFIFSLIIAFILSIITYQLAILISPPEFHDSITGETHLVMPMGQVAIAILSSVLCFITSFIILYRKYPLLLKKFFQKEA